MASTETHSNDAEITADMDLSATGIARPLNGLANAGRALGVIGLIGLVVGVIAGSASGGANPAGLVLQAYSYGFVFWLSLTLGCLGLVILHNVIKATWTHSILRIVEAGSSNLPYILVLFLPFAAAVWAGWYGGANWGHAVYHWADQVASNADPVLKHKQIYLSPWTWTIRAALYFGIWLWYWNYLVKSGHRQDKTRDPNLQQARVDRAAPGLVVFMVTVTFAMTDWVMSFDPHWFSTIYGAWWAISGVLNAIAFSTLIVLTFRDRKPFSYIVTPALTKDLGNMMLGFTMLWAYFSLSQFLIYWSGNLPEYITFYVNRFRGPWVYVGGFLILAQFFGPFLALIAGKTKRRFDLLVKVAGWVFVVRMIDVLWQTVPFFQWTLGVENLGAIALAFAGWAFVGGVWISGFVSHLKKHPVIAPYDTRNFEAKLGGGHH